jgi:hypothetical protein
MGDLYADAPRPDPSSPAAGIAGSAHDSHDRVRFFDGELLSASDFRTEQDYNREQRRLHNRRLHGWGVVSGCDVTAGGPQTDSSWEVSISSGYALTATGDDIDIVGDIRYELTTGCAYSRDGRARARPLAPEPAPSSESRVVRLAVHAIELLVGEVSGLTGPEFSRIRDAYELACFDALPDGTEAWVVLAGLRLVPGTDESPPIVEILPEYRDPLSLNH